jgi:hypothetical protein
MTTASSMTFRRWLRAQRHRHDHIGALAQDIAQDVRIGCLTASTYARIKGHLRRTHEASAKMLHALEQAYHEWSVVTGGHSNDRD